MLLFFTYELDRLLKRTGVTANCLHPRVVSTSIARKNSRTYVRFLWGIYRLFMLSPAEGAQTSIYLATAGELSGISGKYFEKCRVKQSSTLSYDQELAKKLWRISEELTGYK